MRIKIGNFVREGLEGEWGPDLSTSVDRALDEYLDRLADEDLNPLPALYLSATRDGDKVAVSIGPVREIQMIEESVRRGCSIDDLASEAIVHHLAELDRRQTTLSTS